MKIKSPILYCCYNRLNLIKKSLKVLQDISCSNLYIAIDGSKNKQDEIIVDEVIKYIKKIKFKSNVKFLIRNKNLGCKIAISSAIDWFFSHEEEGIILEEDILPSQNFFYFCEYTLDKYRNNEKIFMINGTNYLGLNKSNKYFYSQHFLIWGWATWKRAWKHYDVEMKEWHNEVVKNKLKDRYSKQEFDFLNQRFNSLFQSYKDTWDIQWYFTCVINNKLAIMPEANLVSNIGIHGTHSNEFYKTLFLKVGEIDIKEIIPSTKIERNEEFDLKLHKKYNFKKPFKEFLKKIYLYLLNFTK